MHAGPLGALPDAIGSCVVEMCDEGVFGGETLSPWELRLQVQLNVAFAEFVAWGKDNGAHHTIKRFSKLAFSMKKTWEQLAIL